MMRSMFVSLVVLVGMASASVQATHSLEKRQTAITDLGLVKDEVSRWFSGNNPIDWTQVALVIGGLIILDLILAVIVGIVIGLIRLNNQRSDTSSKRQQNLQQQSHGTGGVLDGLIHSLVNNRIDIVESALDLMSVEEDACRHKAVCMAEKAAVSNSFAKLAINTINSNLSGLQRYRQAVEAGLAGQDCDLIYDQCRERVSFF